MFIVAMLAVVEAGRLEFYLCVVVSVVDINAREIELAARYLMKMKIL